MVNFTSKQDGTCICKGFLEVQMHTVTIYDIIKRQCSSLTKCNLFIKTSVWLRSIFVTSKDKVRMDMLFPIHIMLLNDAIQSIPYNSTQKSHVIFGSVNVSLP